MGIWRSCSPLDDLSRESRLKNDILNGMDGRRNFEDTRSYTAQRAVEAGKARGLVVC